MATLVTPVRLGIRGITQVWDEALAVGVGIIAVDFIGNLLRTTIGKVVPAAWVDPATEGVVGFIIIALGEYLAPAGWQLYTRLAGVAALGLAVADGISILLGMGASPLRGIKESSIASALKGESEVSFA